MEQRVSLITLGVANLTDAIAFYEHVVGWKASASPPEIAFFDLNGMIFSLLPHAELAKDMGLSVQQRPTYESFALAYNARSKDEVDAIFARLAKAGAPIVKAPQPASWGGYSGSSPTSTGTSGKSLTTPTGRCWQMDALP